MAANSVMTNYGAMVALQSLNRTADEMSTTQKRVSTGLRVSDAKDDGAAFAVAQKVRGDVAGVTSANEQLGNAKGLLDTTLAGLTQIGSALKDVKTVMIKLADDNVTGTDRENYMKQYDQLAKQIGQYVNDATYNGKSLLGVSANADGATAADGSSYNVVRNEKGDTYSFAGQTAGAFDLTLSATVATGADDAANALLWKAALSGTGAGEFGGIEAQTNLAMATYGNDSRAIDSQIAYNKDKLDALSGGLGALIDADLAKESARMQSLQIRQQLGTQSLSTANQAPQALLKLFQ
ncbi:flagellin [Roseomonas stagni]|uniref:Flagellin n=1 Tax=Falsiroseomonas algicola TaxID=2716930 RepID=A0A6M1LNY7_9PROT|nr:flagellin [Falsiroseomonas algicola]NGM21752.1 flagellin [Falsiroseomonas algicola]